MKRNPLWWALAIVWLVLTVLALRVVEKRTKEVSLEHVWRITVSDENTVKRERWVYAGQVRSTTDRSIHKWLRVEGEAPLEALPPIDEKSEEQLPLYFDKARNLAPGRPGAVYQFDVEYQDDDPTGILTAGREYLGIWPHRDQVTVWQLRHDADRARARAEKLAKQERSRNIWQERLAPVRELYQRTPTAGRAALLAMIVEYVARP